MAPRILAVDLEAGLRDALASGLAGARVHAPATADEAAAALSAGGWDLVVAADPAGSDPRWTAVLSGTSAPSSPPVILLASFDFAPEAAGMADGRVVVLPPTVDAATLARRAAALLGRPAAGSPSVDPASVDPASADPASADPAALDPASRTEGGGGAEARMASAVAGVWERFRDVIFARVAALDEAALGMLEGTLDDEARRRAEREAHKLAGSVGTFGFAEGSAVARELEHLYAVPPSGDPADALRASDLAVALRRALERSPVAAPAPAAAPSDTPARRPVLLVADPEPEVAQRVAMEAGGRGFDARTVGSLAELRAEAERQAPAAVLVDIGLEGTAEALATIDWLASRTPSVPVVVLTAQGTFADRVDVARRGACAFLAKPAPPARVVDAVQRVLHRSRETGSTVMAVDDDPAVLEAMAALIAPTGATLHTLDDPLRFWDALERVNPDLLVLDVDMPHLSGIELCRVVRNDARWTSLPVLFLTARTDDATIQALFAAGADDYVRKPFVAAELVTRIRNRLERVRLHRSLADTDGLTGVANRRRCEESVGQLLRLAARQGQPLSLAVLDLDHFKQVNDRAGHAVGDEVIRRMAKQLTGALRAEDVVARWGGEEFVVAMFGSEKDDAVARLEACLAQFREIDFAEADGDEPVHVGFSGGVAQFAVDGADLNALYRAADGALYLAKAQGRGRVLPAGWSEEAPGRSDAVDVLVVDDDEALAPLLVHALETRGYRTRWVADGQEAAALLLGPRPALRARVVLMDVDLPGLDGLGLLRAMAREKVLGRTRVIMLTVRSVEEEVVQSLEQGAFDHVAKPFSVPVLLQRVRRALRD